MNKLESAILPCPTGQEEPCAKFVIENPSDAFGIYDVCTTGQDYTMRFWIKCESVTVGDDETPVASFTHPWTADADGVTMQNIFSAPVSQNEWVEYVKTFTAQDDDLAIIFSHPGTYYIYHLQIENGTIATDWTVAQEDIDESIHSTNDRIVDAASRLEILEDRISSIVTLGERFTQVEQSIDGLTITMGNVTDWQSSTSGSLGELQQNVERLGAESSDMSEWQKNASSSIDKLQTDRDDAQGRLSELERRQKDYDTYVRIGKYYADGNEENTDPSNVKPCVELGEGDTSFKARITNTTFDLLDNETVHTSVDKDGISTGSIALRGEHRMTNPSVAEGGSYIWSIRKNGNYGLSWKG